MEIHPGLQQKLLILWQKIYANKMEKKVEGLKIPMEKNQNKTKERKA